MICFHFFNFDIMRSMDMNIEYIQKYSISPLKCLLLFIRRLIFIKSAYISNLYTYLP